MLHNQMKISPLLAPPDILLIDSDANEEGYIEPDNCWFTVVL